jgi:hypothetical protein
MLWKSLLAVQLRRRVAHGPPRRLAPGGAGREGEGGASWGLGALHRPYSL